MGSIFVGSLLSATLKGGTRAGWWVGGRVGRNFVHENSKNGFPRLDFDDRQKYSDSDSRINVQVVYVVRQYSQE